METKLILRLSKSVLEGQITAQERKLPKLSGEAKVKAENYLADLKLALKAKKA